MLKMVRVPSDSQMESRLLGEAVRDDARLLDNVACRCVLAQSSVACSKFEGLNLI